MVVSRGGMGVVGIMRSSWSVVLNSYSGMVCVVKWAISLSFWFFKNIHCHFFLVQEIECCFYLKVLRRRKC